VATAGLSPADISSPIRVVVAQAEERHGGMAEVTGVDLEKQEVLLGEQRPPMMT